MSARGASGSGGSGAGAGGAGGGAGEHPYGDALSRPLEGISHEDLLTLTRYLRVALGTEYTRANALAAELRALREQYVALGARFEEEEEAMTNKLFKRLDKVNADQRKLIMQAETEQDFITNTLQKKLTTLQKDKINLETQLEREQEFLVNRLQKQLQSLTEEKNRLLHRLEQATVRERRASQSSSDAIPQTSSQPMTPRTRNTEEQEAQRLMTVIEKLRKRLLDARADAARYKNEQEERAEALKRAYDENYELKQKLARDEARFDAIVRANLREEQEFEAQINRRRASLPANQLVGMPLPSPRMIPVSPALSPRKRSPSGMRHGHRRHRSVQEEPVNPAPLKL